MLILDEAASNLDTENEQAIAAAIATEQAGLTRIVIAQRLSTIRDANRIVVMADGRIVTVGAHDELMATAATYRTSCAPSPSPTRPDPAGRPSLAV